MIENMNLIAEYDADRELNRQTFLKGAMGRFRKQVTVKHALNPFDRVYTLLCGHFERHHGTCEAFDNRVDMGIKER